MKKYTHMLIFLFSVPAIIIIGILFMQQKAFGQQPKNERLQRIEKSPNYKNGRFQNLNEVIFMSKETRSFKFLKEMLRKHENATPPFELPVVKTTLTDPVISEPQIFWFGHSSYLIKTESANILVDPVFSKRASPVSFTGVESFAGTNVFTPNDLPNIDILIITHDHYDHMDYKTIMALEKRTTYFVVPLGVGQHLDRWGIGSEKIIELDWWETQTFDQWGINLVCTPAQHFSGRGLVRNKSLWASFVILTPHIRIYAGGDSGYGKHFKQIGEKYGPFDMAMLECGQYNTYWPQIHSMPEETAQAAVDLQARVLLPVHWGKFRLAMHAWDEPVLRVSKKAAELGIAITTPIIGEPVSVIKPAPENLWVNFGKNNTANTN